VSPIDLTAIEARLLTMTDQLKRDGAYRARAGDDVQALVAHVRALRAALYRVCDARPGSSVPEDMRETVEAFAAAEVVLASVTDGEAAP
jgi:hypothetical protein